ncbi:MAG: HEPN domain-containing protein [Methanobacteriota archaeon]|nr:MAG: HEPN domain-containing protein [Euryarchaeota archaeon]
MPPKRDEPGSPNEWLARAKSNLLLGKVDKTEGIYWEDLCFQLQQAVEKALKAVLRYNNIDFPYIHDIARLITLIQNAGIPWPDELSAAANLTEFAVETRYPGIAEEVTEEEYRQTVDIAEKVIEWAEKIIR